MGRCITARKSKEMLETQNAPHKIYDLDTKLWRNDTVAPAHTLSRAPLSSPQSYYRSKIYTTALGINPLVASASAIFTLAAKLRESESYTDINSLYQQLTHEIRAFENNAQAHNYRSDNILVARYVLCVLLDEVILQSSWGKISNWERHKLLVTFHNEPYGGERFFVILERIIEDPALHIDLLELMYLCLSFGLEGKYRHYEYGKIELDAVTEKLFECIRYQRDDLKKDFTTLQKPTIAPRTIQKSMDSPLWLIGTVTVTVLLTIYGVFNYLVDANNSRLYQEIQSIQTSINAPSNAVID